MCRTEKKTKLDDSATESDFYPSHVWYTFIQTRSEQLKIVVIYHRFSIRGKHYFRLISHHWLLGKLIEWGARIDKWISILCVLLGRKAQLFVLFRFLADAVTKKKTQKEVFSDFAYTARLQLHYVHVAKWLYWQRGVWVEQILKITIITMLNCFVRNDLRFTIMKWIIAKNAASHRRINMFELVDSA